jgi:hypothetical protein
MESVVLVEQFESDGRDPWLSVEDRTALPDPPRMTDRDGTGLPFSASLWFKKTETGSYSYLLSRGGWMDNYSLGVMSSSDPQSRKIRAFAGKGLVLLSTTTISSPGAWHHVALTSDGSVATLYVNGAQEAAGCFEPGNPEHEDLPLFLGFEALGLGITHKTHSPRHFLNGEMKRVRVEQRCMGGDEVEAAFQQGIGKPVKSAMKTAAGN